MKHPTVFILLVCLCLAASDSKEDTGNEYLVCSTAVCTERGKLINASLNHSADPCDDFYSYACGGWKDRHKRRRESESFGILDQLTINVRDTLKRILEQKVADTKPQNIFEKARIIYNACTAIPETEENPDGIVNVLNSHGLQNWPILENDTIVSSLTNNRTAMILKSGIRGVFELTLQRDPHNSTAHILQVRKAAGYAIEEENKKEVMQKAALLIKPNASRASIAAFVESVATYGKKLKNLRGSKQASKVSIRELQRNFSSIPLLSLLNIEFQKVNTTLSVDDTVELHPIGFYSALNEFLKEAEPITMFNYAGSSVLSTFGEHISKDFRKEFLKARNSRNIDRERWEECVELVRNKMPEILDCLYVHGSHNTAAMTELQDIATRIKVSFLETFQNNTWISNSTKEALIDTLNKTTISIGYPVWLMNHSFLQELYKDVPEIDRQDSFVEMLNIISNSHYKRQLMNFRQYYNGSKNWVGHASDVKALYSRLDNKVEIPWGLLQPPIYQSELPRSLSFGGIGAIIARELSHACSTKGTMSKTPEDGNNDILSSDTRTVYKEKAQCFVTQYSNITVRPPEIEGTARLKGYAALEDNVADNVGLRSAYSAYIRLLEEECAHTDTRLQGFKQLSGKHLFFIAKAMETCKVWKDFDLWRKIQFSSVIPPRYRVNVALTNLEAFAAAFNCTERSRMRAKGNETCKLW